MTKKELHLIDKSALVAEIERRISNHNKELQHASDEDFVSSWASDEENKKTALVALIPFINTLETKEVELEEEITNIEYIRKDAFIEKATEWLCYNYDKYIRIIGSSVYPAYTELCKDFQKAMKGE